MSTVPIHKLLGFSYIRISELPLEEQQPFAIWIQHQTRPLIDNLEPQDACYLWDYSRWKQGSVIWD